LLEEVYSEVKKELQVWGRNGKLTYSDFTHDLVVSADGSSGVESPERVESYKLGFKTYEGLKNAIENGESFSTRTPSTRSVDRKVPSRRRRLMHDTKLELVGSRVVFTKGLLTVTIKSFESIRRAVEDSPRKTISADVHIRLDDLVFGPGSGAQRRGGVRGT